MKGFDRFKNLELLSSERAALPTAEQFKAWSESPIWEEMPVPFYPGVDPVLISISALHASQLTYELVIDFRYPFEWARIVEGHFIAQGVDVPETIPENLRSAVEAFRHATLCFIVPDIKTEREWYSPGLTWTLIGECWKSVKHPAGSNILELANSRALKRPMSLNREFFGSEWTTELEWVASIAFNLQSVMGEMDFFLPTEFIGNMLGFEGVNARKWGSRLLGPLKRAGLLIEKGGYVPGSKCMRLRFAVKRTDLYSLPK